jgi:hypothetical protein
MSLKLTAATIGKLASGHKESDSLTFLLARSGDLHDCGRLPLCLISASLRHSRQRPEHKTLPLR